MTGSEAAGPPVTVNILDGARTELRADIARGTGGRASLERYSDRIDALLRRLVTDAPRPSVPVALVATGGYGRRHLCLHSDIDLLVLFGGPIGQQEERFCAPSCTRCGTWAWWSGIRCASSRISAPSSATTPSSCWR